MASRRVAEPTADEHGEVQDAEFDAGYDYIGWREALVPPDHFYRQLERRLDLSFVRELVRDRDAPTGRPSVDPVVFFKLQLVMFFEGIRARLGLPVFRRFLERVVERCQEAGLVWGGELHFDATRMATRYMGPERGPEYLTPTLDRPRWRIRVRPDRVTAWAGGGWHARYTDG